MNPLQAMTLRVARSATASMSPSERKKMVMDLFKRFKGMGDASIKGGKHQVMLATEDYSTVVLEDADDAELNRIFTKYDVANWLKKFEKKASTAASRVADGTIVQMMQKATGNLNKASSRLLESQGYVGGVTDLLVEALGFIKAANSDMSDSDMEEVLAELTALLRRVDTETKSLSNAIRGIQHKVIESRNQLGSEIAWELQHPID